MISCLSPYKYYVIKKNPIQARQKSTVYHFEFRRYTGVIRKLQFSDKSIILKRRGYGKTVNQ